MTNLHSASWGAWQSALFSTFLISSFPNIFLYLVPVQWLKGKNEGELNVQHILLAFASGGLLGDVLLHAIPHLMASHGEERIDPASRGGEEGAVWDFLDLCAQSSAQAEGCSAHDPRSLTIGSLVLGGFLFFFTAERIITLLLTSSCLPNSCGDDVGAPPGSVVASRGSVGAGTLDYSALTVKELRDECRERRLVQGGKKADLVERLRGAGSESETESAVPVAKAAEREPAFYETLTASGWLNISADFMHNFTDGLAMGVTHASGDGKLALAATLSIFCHEVPHEVGDFTMLIENGMSKNNAIRMQFFTSAGAFLGTVIGMLASSLDGWDDFLIAFTSGGFLYVSTVSLIPAILNKPPLSGASRTGEVLQIALESISFALGVGMMVVVSLDESHHH